MLHQAAFYGNLKILQELLKCRSCIPFIHAKDINGKQPIHKAVWGDPKPHIVQYLLDQGADPNAKKAYDYTPLHWAAKYGHLESAKILISAKASCLAINKSGDTPFDLALKWGQDDILHFCLGTKNRLPVKERDPIFKGPEGYYYKCLMDAKREGLIEEQIVHLAKLHLIYLDKEDFVRAAKLLNGALAIFQNHCKNSDFESFLFIGLERIERRFLAKMSVKSSAFLKEEIIGYRNQLTQIRKAHQNRFKGDESSVIPLLKDLTDAYRKLLADLIEDAQELFGSSPVKWACMGLGSMARGEMCLYSDVEFAFVIEKRTPKILEYFRNLSWFLELRFINLGETAFPVFRGVDPENPSPTPNGFCLDEGGNGPLGVPRLYELIDFPEALCRFQTMQWINANIILANVMNTTCCVTGDPKLIARYHRRKKELTQQKISKQDTRTNSQVLAERLLKGHLQEFAPSLSQEKEQLHAFGIKKEFYRPFQAIIGGLSLFYNLKSKRTVDRIDELVKLGVFSSKGADNLKKAMSLVFAFRFEAHAFYQSEKEYLCHPKQGQSRDPQLLYVGTSHIEHLQTIYNVLLPFQRCASEFFKTKNESAFSDNHFYDDGPSSRGYMLSKTLKYENAKKAYQQAVALNPNDVDACLRLGFLNGEMGHTQEQFKRNEQTLKIALEKYGENSSEVALSYNNLGSAFYALGDAKKGIEYYQKSLKIRLDLYGEQHSLVATSYGNLGTAYNFLGDVKQALEYYKKSLKIALQVYERNHPCIAISYNNLGEVYRTLGDAKKGIEYHQKALEIGVGLYGETHSLVASFYNNLGGDFRFLKDPENAISCYQRALITFTRLHGEIHPDVQGVFIMKT